MKKLTYPILSLLISSCTTIQNSALHVFNNAQEVTDHYSNHKRSESNSENQSPQYLSKPTIDHIQEEDITSTINNNNNLNNQNNNSTGQDFGAVTESPSSGIISAEDIFNDRRY